MAAFTNSETQTFFHCDRGDQLNFDVSVVAGHNHFHAGVKFDRTCNVRCTEIELRTVSLEERAVTSAFFLGQNVNLTFEFTVRCNALRFSNNLSSFDFFTVDTAKKKTNVVTCKCFVKKFGIRKGLSVSRAGVGM